MRLAALAAVGSIGCFAPSPHPGGLCAEGGRCPAPLTCDPASNTCVAPGTPDAGGCVIGVEVCDGMDQDCDQAVDEDFPLGAACTVAGGTCQAPGTFRCGAGGTGVVCVAIGGLEICGDGIDQDCDQIDPPCPVNDAPAGAIDVSLGGAFTGELAAARDDASGSCGAPGGRDLFYEIIVPTDEVVYVDSFGSDFDVVVRLHVGACAPALGVEGACADNACGGTQVQLAGLIPAGTYCAVVDQALGAAEVNGHVELRVIRGQRPGIGLVGPAGTVTGTTVGGANLSVPICEGDSMAAPDVGYFFALCPGVTVTATADTCANTPYDSWLSIRAGDGRAGPELACLDDSCGDDAMISAMVTGPGLYWFLVDGWANEAGTYAMDYAIQ